MYSYFKGVLVEKQALGVVVEVNDIGYGIATPLSTLTALGDVGSTIKLYVYLHVKEDDLSLFGFANLKEKNLFKQLIKTSGIGVRYALNILSTLSYDEFSSAIATGSIESLTRIPGIGKKTAERLILDIADKLVYNPSKNLLDNKLKQALEALQSLGYSKQQANSMLNKIDGNENLNLENLIKLALSSA